MTSSDIFNIVKVEFLIIYEVVSGGYNKALSSALDREPPMFSRMMAFTREYYVTVSITITFDVRIKHTNSSCVSEKFTRA